MSWRKERGKKGRGIAPVPMGFLALIMLTRILGLGHLLLLFFGPFLSLGLVVFAELWNQMSARFQSVLFA